MTDPTLTSLSALTAEDEILARHCSIYLFPSRAEQRADKVGHTAHRARAASALIGGALIGRACPRLTPNGARGVTSTASNSPRSLTSRCDCYSDVLLVQWTFCTYYFIFQVKCNQINIIVMHSCKLLKRLPDFIRIDQICNYHKWKKFKGLMKNKSFHLQFPSVKCFTSTHETMYAGCNSRRILTSDS